MDGVGEDVLRVLREALALLHAMSTAGLSDSVRTARPVRYMGGTMFRCSLRCRSVLCAVRLCATRDRDSTSVKPNSHGFFGCSSSKVMLGLCCRDQYFSIAVCDKSSRKQPVASPTSRGSSHVFLA